MLLILVGVLSWDDLRIHKFPGLATRIQRLNALFSVIWQRRLFWLDSLHFLFSVSWERTWSGGFEDNEKNKSCFRSQQYYESRKAYSSSHLFLKSSPRFFARTYMHVHAYLVTCVHILSIHFKCCTYRAIKSSLYIMGNNESWTWSMAIASGLS